MKDFRYWLSQALMRLARSLIAEYGPEVQAAIENVVMHAARKHQRKIEELVAAYYQSTSIPPEDAVIVVQRNGNNVEIHIEPKLQDWEEPEPA